MIREGMKAQVLPNDTNTSGYVQQRQFQRESVAMIFLLESVFGDNTGSTYKSVTERNAAYVTNCLGRWINKIQDECDLKLLSQRQKATGSFCYKMDTSCLWKHDKLAVAQYTNSLFMQQSMTPNEIRELHGLPPHKDGDDLPSNSPEPAENEEKAVPEKGDQTQETSEEKE